MALPHIGFHKVGNACGEAVSIFQPFVHYEDENALASYLWFSFCCDTGTRIANPLFGIALITKFGSPNRFLECLKWSNN